MKVCTKKFVKNLSKCKFYKKYGNTADSTEKTVEPSVFQSRNFHVKDQSHHFAFNGLWNCICQKSGHGQAKRSKIFSAFSEYVRLKHKTTYSEFGNSEIWEFGNLQGPSIQMLNFVCNIIRESIHALDQRIRFLS
jgi:hypothetical protein